MSVRPKSKERYGQTPCSHEGGEPLKQKANEPIRVCLKAIGSIIAVQVVASFVVNYVIEGRIFPPLRDILFLTLWALWCLVATFIIGAFGSRLMRKEFSCQRRERPSWWDRTWWLVLPILLVASMKMFFVAFDVLNDWCRKFDWISN